MPSTRTKLAKLEAEMQEQRLAKTVDPLERAWLKERLNVPLDLWSDSELYALSEHLEPGFTEHQGQRRAAYAEQLARMMTTELLAELARFESRGDRQRDPLGYAERWRKARQLAEAEQQQHDPFGR